MINSKIMQLDNRSPRVHSIGIRKQRHKTQSCTVPFSLFSQIVGIDKTFLFFLSLKFLTLVLCVRYFFYFTFSIFLKFYLSITACLSTLDSNSSTLVSFRPIEVWYPGNTFKGFYSLYYSTLQLKPYWKLFFVLRSFIIFLSLHFIQRVFLLQFLHIYKYHLDFSMNNFSDSKTYILKNYQEELNLCGKSKSSKLY